MSKRIDFEGEVHEFPDDFTDADIGKALKSIGSAPSAQANRALAGTGLEVSGPKNGPTPSGLAPDETNPWKDPTQGLIGQGVRQMGRGVAGLSREGLDPKLEALSDITGGAARVAAIPLAAAGGAALAPVVGPAGMAAGLVGGAALGTGLGMAGRAGSEALGAGPGLQELTGQAGEAVGAGLGFKGGAKTEGLMKVDPRVAVNRSLRPTPSDPGFSKRIPQTLASVKSANPGFKPEVENGELNLTPATTRAINVAQDALQPWLTRAQGTKISGEPIIRATVDAAQMLPSEAGSSKALIQRAQMDYGYEFTPQQLRDRLALLNERLDPFYSKSPNKQSSALADIPEAVLKAQRDAVADTLYRHLDPEGEGAGPRLIQSRTGDLMDLRNASQRRQNAILAEQPLTPLGRIVDPLKGAIRSIMPGKATGAGIAYAEGSEGRSLPLLKRAFSAVEGDPNVLPQPQGLYPRSTGQRQLGAGVPRMSEASGSSFVRGEAGTPAETEWPRLGEGRRVTEMGAVPDMSGDRSWTGPTPPPNPLRQLPGGPQAPITRQGSGAMPVQPITDKSFVKALTAEPVIDPETGQIMYYKGMAKGGVVAPPNMHKRPQPPQIPNMEKR